MQLLTATRGPTNAYTFILWKSCSELPPRYQVVVGNEKMYFRVVEECTKYKGLYHKEPTQSNQVPDISF